MSKFVRTVSTVLSVSLNLTILKGKKYGLTGMDFFVFNW